MNRKVSIIVPIYNKEKFIDKLIPSLLDQTYKDIEIICIDDGSKDNSYQKCKSYKDKRIKLIHKENGGVSTARNTGLDNATGEFIAFVDADDFIEKDYIEKLVNNIKDSDVCECGFNRVDEDGNILDKFIPREETIVENKLIQEYYLNYNNTNDFLWNKLYTRKVIKNIKFPNYKCSEDFLFIAKVNQNVTSKTTISDQLYNYVCNNLSVGNEEFTSKKLDVIYAREEAFCLYNDNLSYLVATQILYQCSVLYTIADSESKKIIKDKFRKYYKYLYKVKCNFIKKIYRIIKYSCLFFKMK